MADVDIFLRDIPFVKMSGSGNDFVFIDGRRVDRARVTSPEAIQAICDRRRGVGADGLVVLEPTMSAEGEAGVGATIFYFNSDGSPADLCGNATLCSTRLAVDWEIAASTSLVLTTPAGPIRATLCSEQPQIELPPVSAVTVDSAVEAAPGERRIGFALAGIPHLVVLCDDADTVDVAGRGPVLRRHAAGGPSGANVNWVSALPNGRWRYRTFERGVEGETLACGTGAVATAVLLASWGLVNNSATIQSSSGRDLDVSLTRDGDRWIPRLSGEGRVVYRGVIENLSW
ncbi:MAG: diaminopimelate epimerase [Gemmatimonadaceae bacterium]|nr:diaminopimelate epimerase [Gemmatimonadaceae bacterium]